MNKLEPQFFAGEVLRNLIKENYPSQEEFAFEYGKDVRTINRYINDGIDRLSIMQELATFFNIEYTVFLEMK